ncbi:nucleotide exchange factor GrpE [Mycoplasma seminis]|uniref:Protein GrpE n=1 Tax=Mycoplasma seminis TaxID=512749 RepID=A0ABY9HC30_9MOLU|nr:nucleotide exchange factor GrpE [Mycoplasma seminis]WLP85740.1 nucleotide exchange factor GrpE [Mycoplasma seminis]
MNNTKLHIGNKISGDFTLYIEEQIIPEYSKHAEITLGKEEYLPNFDEYLIGRKVKEDMEVKFTFAKNYPIAALAGNKAKVEIKNLTLAAGEDKNEYKITELEKEIAELKAKLADKEHKLITQEYVYKNKLEEIQAKAKTSLEAEHHKMHEKLAHEKKEIKKYALQGFFEDFMQPYNNFMAATNAGVNSDSEVVRNYCYGFSIVTKQFATLLEEHGAYIVEPEVGSEFDPETSEVFDFIQDESKTNNTIVKVVRLGLKIDARLVKPAGVIVVKNDK